MSANNRGDFLWHIDPPLTERTKEWYEGRLAAEIRMTQDREHQLWALKREHEQLLLENARLRAELHPPPKPVPTVDEALRVVRETWDAEDFHDQRTEIVVLANEVDRLRGLLRYEQGTNSASEPSHKTE